MISSACFFIKYQLADRVIELDNSIFDRKNAVFIRRFNESNESFNYLTVTAIDEFVCQSDAVIGEEEGTQNAIKPFANIRFCDVHGEYTVFVFCFRSRVFFAEFLQIAVYDRYAVTARGALKDRVSDAVIKILTGINARTGVGDDLLAVLGVNERADIIVVMMLLVVSALCGSTVRDLTPTNAVGKLQGVRMVFGVLIPMLIGPMIGNAINAARNIPLPDIGSADAMTTQYIPAPEIFLVASVVTLLMMATLCGHIC